MNVIPRFYSAKALGVVKDQSFADLFVELEVVEKESQSLLELATSIEYELKLF